MNIDQLMTTHQQRTLYQMLKENKKLTLQQIYIFYKSKTAAKEFIERMIAIGVMRVSDEANTFVYLDKTNPIVLRQEFIDAIKEWQPEYENVIPQIRIYNSLITKGTKPKDITLIRDEFVNSGWIRISDEGKIIILSKDLIYHKTDEDKEEEGLP